HKRLRFYSSRLDEKRPEGFLNLALVKRNRFESLGILTYTILRLNCTFNPKKIDCQGTSQTSSSNASEEKDEDVELIVVPSTVRNTEEKAESMKSSTNSKKEEILTEPQQEKKASSTDTLEDNPKILAFRRELEEIALKHLGKVSENTSTSTPSVNIGSESVNTSTYPCIYTYTYP
ncbi:hypothetical protein Tco_0964559, partial [Tanacetum coccineum]